MGAMFVQQPDAVGFISEQDQFFTQYFDHQWQVAQLAGHCNRLPESSQVLPTGRAVIDVGQFLVFTCLRLMGIALEAGGSFSWLVHGGCCVDHRLDSVKNRVYCDGPSVHRSDRRVFLFSKRGPWISALP